MPKFSGRPKIHSEEAVMSALASMTMADDPLTFTDLLAGINIQLPMSRSVAYKFINSLTKSGFLKRVDGGFIRGAGRTEPA